MSAHPSAEHPPHLFLVAPAGFLCCLCLSWWPTIADPYALCVSAPQYARDAIATAEAAAGVTIDRLYERSA